jgi:NitT/TauT family transport system substrate-binding protein
MRSGFLTAPRSRPAVDRSPAATAVVAVALALAACAPTAPAAPPAAAPPAAVAQVAAPSSTAIAPTPTAPPAPNRRVTYGTQGSIADAAIFIALARGYFAAEGLDLELVEIADLSVMLQALATAQIDSGGTAPSAPMINAVQRGVDVRAVAERGSNSPGRGYTALVVRKDLVDSGEFKDYADLKGRRIGALTPIGGLTQSVDLLDALKLGGLTMQDARVEPLAAPELNQALAGGVLDVIVNFEPFVSAAVANGFGVRWKGGDEIHPNHMIGALVYSASFAADQLAARAFMVAYVRAARDYNDALNKNQGKDDLYQILTRYSTVKDPAVIARMVLPGIAPEPRVNLESVQRDVAGFVEMGTIPGPVDLSSLVDNSFVDYAAERLGPYR